MINYKINIFDNDSVTTPTDEQNKIDSLICHIMNNPELVNTNDTLYILSASGIGRKQIK